MFKTLILKINQGPWGPWSKGKEKDKADKNNAGKPSKEIEKKEEPKQEPKQEDQKQNNAPQKEPEKQPEQEPEKEPEKKEEPKKEEPKQEAKQELKEEVKKEPEKRPEINSEPKNVVKGPWSGEEYNKKYDKIITELMSKSNSAKANGNGSNGNGFNNNNGGGTDFIDRLSKSPKKFGGLIVLFAITLWLATGFYKVDSDENAVILYFGKFHSITTPGLNYHVPFPIGKAIKQRVAAVNSEEFGYVQNSRRRNTNDIENLMLTGDENIVDIEFQVQWQISNIEEFTFNVSQPNLAIRKAAESAMREIIAKTPIYEALSDGKSRIESETRELLQQTLDSYSSGVRVILVQLRRVDPPKQVIDAFRDVQTAKADKEREINEAQAYANDIIPRARGNAAEMEEKAKAYQKQVEADAEGEAARFLSLYTEYKDAKEITRKRIYLETMQQVYGEIDKVIIDDEVSNGGVLPYFPINDLKNKQ